MPTIEIDAEFRSLIPPLSEEEGAQLEANLRTHGCRDPLVVWKGHGILLDGHNRRDICERHGVAYQVVDVELPDRRAALLWIIWNQLGRRNLAPYQRAELALKLEPLFVSQAKENQRRGGGSGISGRQNSDKPTDTKKELAKAAGVSHDTIAKAKVIDREAPEPVKQQLRKGETSVNAAYRDLRPKAPTESKPAAPGQSKVNGVLAPDPPDIAAARAAGKIAPETVVEVTEPDPAAEPEPETLPDPADVSDAEWLAALPLSAKLTGSCRKTFEADALVYRRLESHRKTFAHHATRAMNAEKRKGAYVWQIKRYLKCNDPSKWLICTDEANGGCGGSGTTPFGKCGMCHGCGYRILGG